MCCLHKQMMECDRGARDDEIRCVAGDAQASVYLRTKGSDLLLGLFVSLTPRTYSLRNVQDWTVKYLLFPIC